MDTLNDLFALWREDYDLGVLMLAGGGMIGLLFGIFAERTDFCSRAAFARLLGGTWRQDGTSLLYLLLAMLAAITGVQGLAFTDAVDFSISGESDLRFGGIVVGGLLFGIGMALSRGCISRLLVLTGRGNSRALITLGFLGLVAWSSISGILSAPRAALAGWLRLPYESGFSPQIAMLTALVLVAGIVLLLPHRRAPVGGMITAVLIGLMVPLAFIVTGMLGADDFEPVPLEGLLFTRPITESFAYFAYGQTLSLKFGIGLIPGCIIGAAVSAAVAGRSHVEGFGPDTPHPLRYLAGATLMGFGGVVCGGCSVGWMLTNAAIGHQGLLLAVISMLMGMKLAQASFRFVPQSA